MYKNLQSGLTELTDSASHLSTQFLVFCLCQR